MGDRRSPARTLLLVPVLWLVLGCHTETHIATTPLHDTAAVAPTRPPGQPPVTRADTPRVDRFRGQLLLGPDVGSLQPCGDTGQVWVVDSTGGDLTRAYGQLTTRPYERLYVEVEGEWAAPRPDDVGAGYGRSLVVRRLERANATQGASACEIADPPSSFEARGNEPFWLVDFTSERVAFSRPGGGGAIIFPGVSALSRSRAPHGHERPGRGSWVYAAHTTVPRHAIRISIRDARCIDSMSGEFFGFVVDVLLDGRQYAGCGMEGARGLPLR